MNVHTVLDICYSSIYNEIPLRYSWPTSCIKLVYRSLSFSIYLQPFAEYSHKLAISPSAQILPTN